MWQRNLHQYKNANATAHFKAAPHIVVHHRKTRFARRQYARDEQKNKAASGASIGNARTAANALLWAALCASRNRRISPHYGLKREVASLLGLFHQYREKFFGGDIVAS